MKSCRTASLVAAAGLIGAGALGACRDRVHAEVPPVTSAHPRDDFPLASSADAAAAIDSLDADAPQGNVAPIVRFVETPAKLEEGVCQTLLFAVVKGQLSAHGEALAPGDVLVVQNPEPREVKGRGLAVEARSSRPCAVRDRPAENKTVVRGSAAPKLEWAGGKMGARLDVGAKVSPDLYLGRLEGTAGVAEHNHASSWEILAAIDAAGTFTLDGKEQRLGPMQIVRVPPGSKHAWKPDPGSKLVAIQMYSPPGPEQRFLALAAAEKDGGALDAGRPPPSTP